MNGNTKSHKSLPTSTEELTLTTRFLGNNMSTKFYTSCVRRKRKWSGNYGQKAAPGCFWSEFTWEPYTAKIGIGMPSVCGGPTQKQASKQTFVGCEFWQQTSAVKLTDTSSSRRWGFWVWGRGFSVDWSMFWGIHVLCSGEYMCLQDSFSKRHGIKLPPLRKRLDYHTLVLLYRIREKLAADHLCSLLPSLISSTSYSLRKHFLSCPLYKKICHSQ